MKMLQYEIVLTVLGSLLFIVLVVLLIYSVVKKAPIGPLATLFVVPIIMVGFPQIQMIKFDNWEVEMNNAAQAVAKNPADPAAQKAFENVAGQVDRSRVSDQAVLDTIAATHLKIAQAQISAGQTDRARINIESAMRLQPQNLAIRKIQQELITTQQAH